VTEPAFVKRVCLHKCSFIIILITPELLISDYRRFHTPWKLFLLSIGSDIPSNLTLISHIVSEKLKMWLIQGLIDAIKLYIFGVKACRELSIFVNMIESILLMIYEQLSLVDQVCLSLSCKRFFYLFNIVAKCETQLLRLRISRLCVNDLEIPRNQLLPPSFFKIHFRLSSRGSFAFLAGVYSW
jgi:hypothetical protein